MLVLSKLRWSLPPVTAADYLGALMPFFPTNRGKLQTNLLEFLINKLIFMPYHEINSKLQTQHSTMLLPVEVHQQPHFSQCCPLLMNSSVFPLTAPSSSVESDALLMLALCLRSTPLPSSPSPSSLNPSLRCQTLSSLHLATCQSPKREGGEQQKKLGKNESRAAAALRLEPSQVTCDLIR